MLEQQNKVAQVVLLFWMMKTMAIIFGEILGYFLTKPMNKGGLYLGTLNASLVAVIPMALMIGYAHRKNIQSSIN